MLFKNIDFKDLNENYKINKNFLHDYPNWIKKSNGEDDIKNYNGGNDLTFFISEDKKTSF